MTTLTSQRSSRLNGEILIENLVVNCIIGILSHERATPQRLVLDVVLETDFSAAASSDRVDDTVNYAQISAQISELAITRQFQLVETLVAEVCQHIIANHAQVTRVTVTARKPDIMPGELTVGARLAMSRD